MPEGLLKPFRRSSRRVSAGVGVVVFPLLFIVLMRGKPSMRRARGFNDRFLTWGVTAVVSA